MPVDRATVAVRQGKPSDLCDPVAECDQCAESISARQCANFVCIMWFCAPRRRIKCQRSALKVTNSNKRKEKGVSGTCLEAV
jgi:hypothetical protein